jgi:DNA-binding CsgD family transcriptional regulator
VSEDLERIYQSITVRRAEVLRELAEGYTEREVAARLGIQVAGVRSHVEDLRAITGCGSARELGRWWRENRAGWLERIGRLAGVETAPPEQ